MGFLNIKIADAIGTDTPFSSIRSGNFALSLFVLKAFVEIDFIKEGEFLSM